MEIIPKVNIHIHVCIFCARSDFWQAHFSGDKPTGAKEVPRAGAGCPVRGLTESLLLSLGPALGPLEAGGGDV